MSIHFAPSSEGARSFPSDAESFLLTCIHANTYGLPPIYSGNAEVDYLQDFEAGLFASGLTDEGLMFVSCVVEDDSLIQLNANVIANRQDLLTAGEQLASFDLAPFEMDEAIAPWSVMRRFAIQPNIILRKGQLLLCVWVLGELATVEEATPLIRALGMKSADQKRPLPETDGWKLVQAREEHFPTLSQLSKGFLSHPILTVDFDYVFPAPAPKQRKTVNASERPKAHSASNAKRQGGLDAAIAKLNEDSTESDIAEAMKLVIRAKLAEGDENKILTRIRKLTKQPASYVRRLFRSLKEAVNGPQKAAHRSSDGARVYGYMGKPDFMIGAKVCIAEIKKENEAAGFPAVCRIGKQPTEMNVDEAGNVSFTQMSYASLWALMSEKVAFVACDPQGSGPREDVPDKVAKFTYERASWLPEAPKVLYAPCFLRDGTLISAPGYNYAPEKGVNHYLSITHPELIKVKSDPTIEDVQESVTWIDAEIFDDFSFNDPANPDKRQAGRANAFAFVITPLMREMIQGLTPFFFPIKAMPGEGASLLGGLPALLQDGKSPQIIPYTGNDEEFQKGLIAAVREGRKHLFLDDVWDLNSKTLHRNLTSSTVTGRLLGTSTNVSVPNDFNWVGTGVNPSVKEESARRIVPIVLNSGLPQEDMAIRTFRHPGTSGKTFEEFVLANREKVLSHFLTLIQFWIKKGQPHWTDKTMLSFEDWARKIGGVLDVCGIEGFLSHTSLTARDAETSAYDEFARRTIEHFGVGASNGETFMEILNHHQGKNSAIVAGLSDREVYNQFLAKLGRINNRPFRIVSDKKRDYVFRNGYDQDKGQQVYYFELVKEEEIKSDSDNRK